MRVEDECFGIAMATDQSEQRELTDHLKHRLRPKRQQSQLGTHKMPIDHSRHAKRAKPNEVEASATMMDSSEDDSEESIKPLPTNVSVVKETVDREARDAPLAREIDSQAAKQEAPKEVDMFASLLALTDIDRKKSAHMANIRRQRQSKTGQLPAITQTNSTCMDTDLLHAVLKTLSTMSGISIANEDMTSTTSVGLFTCRAMRVYALAHEKDPIKPEVQVKTRLDHDQQSKLKKMRDDLLTMLS